MKRRDVVLAAGGVISMPKIAIMVIALAATQWLSWANDFEECEFQYELLAIDIFDSFLFYKLL